MNDMQKYMVLPDRKVVTESVRTELQNILHNLQEGIIPEEKMVLRLEQVLKEYLSVCEYHRDNTLIISAQDETPDTARFFFKNVLPDESDNYLLKETFLADMQNVKFLKRLFFRKLLPEAVNEATKAFIEYLLENGCITLVSLEVFGVMRSYYFLTTKGWHCLRHKETKDFIRKQDASFILPEMMFSDPEVWKEETFKKVIWIQQYYASIGMEDYYIFKDRCVPQMLFGCEIRDSHTVSYCFAANFENALEKQEIAALYEIGQSDKVDELVIIVPSQEDEKRLKVNLEHNVHTLKKLKYYILSEVIDR